MEAILKLIGAKIRTLRKAKQITQEELAERIGTAPSYIGAMERGEQNITVQTLAKVAEALGVTFQQLFEYQGLPSYSKQLVEIFELLNGKSEEDMKRVVIILQQVFK